MGPAVVGNTFTRRPSRRRLTVFLTTSISHFSQPRWCLRRPMVAILMAPSPQRCRSSRVPLRPGATCHYGSTSSVRRSGATGCNDCDNLSLRRFTGSGECPVSRCGTADPRYRHGVVMCALGDSKTQDPCRCRQKRGTDMGWRALGLALNRVVSLVLQAGSRRARGVSRHQLQYGETDR